MAQRLPLASAVPAALEEEARRAILENGSCVAAVEARLMRREAERREAERRIEKVSLRRAGRAVALAVADAGRGMSCDQIREIDAFRQFDRAVFEQQGSGLGLIVIKGIIGASGGSLELTSGVGAGTTACATWPVQA